MKALKALKPNPIAYSRENIPEAYTDHVTSPHKLLTLQRKHGPSITVNRNFEAVIVEVVSQAASLQFGSLSCGPDQPGTLRAVAQAEGLDTH